MPLPRMPTWDQLVLEKIKQSARQPFLATINLGGTGGPGGGGGTPPGGFIGQLTQSQVAYDTTEAATQQGNTSVLDNLNHIRAELYERSWWGF